MENADSTPALSEKSPTDENTASVEATPTHNPVTVGEKPPSDAVADEDSTGMLCETKPAASATVATDDTPSAPSNTTVEMASVPADLVGVGTSSQDEEEGVSDVESEKSQGPSVKTADISEMAARLLDSWKDLKVGLSVTPPTQTSVFIRHTCKYACNHITFLLDTNFDLFLPR